MKAWKYNDKVEFIWNGHYDDPQLRYKGKLYNCFLIEEQLRADFEEFIEEEQLGIGEEDFDKQFELYCKKRPNQVKEVFENFGVDL